MTLKKKSLWLPAFSPFPTMFSSIPKTNFKFLASVSLLSANAFNLDLSENLFGNELKEHFKVGSDVLHSQISCMQYDNERLPHLLTLYQMTKF